MAERITAEAPEYPLWFAVDDDRLGECLAARGFRTVITRTDHLSGTDRIAEANRLVGAARVVNVQGDEPLVTGRQIRLLASLIAGPVDMATLATPFQTAADFVNPNQVKVVCDQSGRARYFSRAPIPFPRDAAGGPDDAWVRSHPCYRHLGLYAYQAELLERFARLPPGRLEQIERLEQLRVLESGAEIAVGFTDDPTIGVDTAEDAGRFALALGASGQIFPA